jgi:ankyrin repeat protein
VEVFVERGVDVNRLRTSGLDCPLCPIEIAVDNGYLGIVEKLLDAGAKTLPQPDSDFDHTTPLDVAINRGCQKTVGLLLEKGHPTEIYKCHERYSDEGLVETICTPLQRACVEGNINMVRLLLESGADVNALPYKEDGITALYGAVYWGYGTIVELLLQNEASKSINFCLLCTQRYAELESADRLHGLAETVLQLSVRKGHKNITKLLLQAGADINAQPGDCSCDLNCGATALYFACNNSDESMVQLLLKNGADASASGRRNGKSALMVACKRNNDRIVRLLLEAGADVNMQRSRPTDSKEPRSALEYAAQFGYAASDIVKLLFTAGASFTEEYIFSHVINGNDYGDISGTFELLLQNNPRVNKQALLEKACSRGDKAIVAVRFLLDMGAVAESKCSMAALLLGDEAREVIRTLKEHGAQCGTDAVQNSWATG